MKVGSAFERDLRNCKDAAMRCMPEPMLQSLQCLDAAR